MCVCVCVCVCVLESGWVEFKCFFYLFAVEMCVHVCSFSACMHKCALCVLLQSQQRHAVI